MNFFRILIHLAKGRFLSLFFCSFFSWIESCVVVSLYLSSFVMESVHVIYELAYNNVVIVMSGVNFLVNVWSASLGQV